MAKNWPRIPEPDADYRGSTLLSGLGVSDGLPIFLPTRERVNEILNFWPTSQLDDSPLRVPPRNGLATPDVIAANAVMTGMPPHIAPYAAAVMQRYVTLISKFLTFRQQPTPLHP